MRPLIENVLQSLNHDWVIRHYHCQADTEEFSCPWHYHTEYELVLYHNPNQNFQGNYFAGDASGTVDDHTLLLYGPGLPHMITGRLHHKQAQALHSTIVWFKPEWIDKIQAILPPTQSIQRLLENSAYGLKLSHATAQAIANQLSDIEKLASSYQALRIIESLLIMAEDQDAQRLSASSYRLSQLSANSEAHKKVHLAKRYIESHFADPIKITDLCRVLHMSESSTYRLFEKHYSMSFSEHLKKFRIGKACELLASSSLPIALVAEKTGFSNLSNFNRQFKAIKAMTPKTFRNQFQTLR
ncbi:AraC family transcriptional regulator [Vibrio metschnikovii]|uniref:helix-turn-helix domain-containing protein n=1 Tax=Vibrio metschnikovii TaxID=28172 RepID=UPI0001B94B32|nr:AraC family transcriptional regulator [Vibrio metschnikovii]EEX36358.1 transcriptional regulator AraC family [Vibrio metschnikovii CIP 69.14]SUP79705.1 AraC family transcriptional regulator [Vibrio metschnikovii]SUQ10397.1 AraC family transcriptional regulator [Vibrio metschnikovii]